MPKDTKTLGNNKARACESLGFVHKKGCARVLTQPHKTIISLIISAKPFRPLFAVNRYICPSY